MRLVFVASLVAGLAAPALAGPDPAKLYAENCARCHQLDGKGLDGAYPGLAGDKITIGPAPAAIRIVLDGKGEMKGFRNRMSDEDMAAALSYTRISWGNAAGQVSAAEFAKVRGK
jgi:cytochrome c6